MGNKTNISKKDKLESFSNAFGGLLVRTFNFTDSCTKIKNNDE